MIPLLCENLRLHPRPHPLHSLWDNEAESRVGMDKIVDALVGAGLSVRAEGDVVGVDRREWRKKGAKR